MVRLLENKLMYPILMLYTRRKILLGTQNCTRYVVSVTFFFLSSGAEKSKILDSRVSDKNLPQHRINRA